LTSISLTSMPSKGAETPFLPTAPHIVVQILGLLLFGGFAIVATVLAFVSFWPAGFALAIVLAWLGFRPMHVQRYVQHREDCASPVVAQPALDRTGNTSFDTYRAAVLKRLEDEQMTFVSFLDRLRDAKDKSEFDTFMDDRAKANLPDVLVTPKAGDY
jgi:Protein of unknown function (DUF2852)